MTVRDHHDSRSTATFMPDTSGCQTRPPPVPSKGVKRATSSPEPGPVAPLLSLGNPRRRPWDETFKRVSANLSAALLGISIAAGATIGIVLLLIKLAAWALN